MSKRGSRPAHGFFAVAAVVSDAAIDPGNPVTMRTVSTLTLHPASPAPPSTASSRPARSLRVDYKVRFGLMLYFNTNVGATLLT